MRLPRRFAPGNDFFSEPFTVVSAFEAGRVKAGVNPSPFFEFGAGKMHAIEKILARAAGKEKVTTGEIVNCQVDLAGV